MTYDLRMSGAAVERAKIARALRRLPDHGLRPDLYFGDADGNVVDGPKGLVTHAVLGVPTSSHGHASKAHVDGAVAIADAIAAATGWRAFDPQLDAHLDSFDHPWRAEQPAAAHQIGALEVRAGRLVIHTAPHAGEPAVWTWTLATGKLAGKPAKERRRDLDAWGREAASPSKKRVARPGSDRRIVRVLAGKKVIAKLTPPGTPRVWEGIRGALVPGARESGRRADLLCWLDDERLAVAYSDGRLCVFVIGQERAPVSVALLDDGRWVALAADGGWDGDPPAGVVQWAWHTDARVYRDVVELAPGARRAGLLAQSSSRPSR